MHTSCVAVLLACGLVASVSAQLRGVSPEKQALYDSSKPFTCFDGSETIPFAHVNDDYCDCADGSDEPGTSACQTSTFYCANEGHEAANIKASAVNDGVCDCCDAADEWATGVCSNTCEEAGRALREARALAYKNQVEGSKKREGFIAKGKEDLNAQYREAEEIQPKLEEAKTVRAKAEEERNKAEEPEKVAKEAHDSEYDLQAKEHRDEVIRGFFDYLDLDSTGTITAEDLRGHLELDADGNGDVSDEEVKDICDRDGNGELSAEESTLDFEQFKEHMYDKIQDKFSESHPKPDDPEKPAYPTNVQELIDAADSARIAFADAERAEKDLQNKLDELTNKINMDYGENREWAQSHGECYELHGEYTYVICPFDKAEQKEGGRANSLGTWKGFDGPEGKKYTVMKFEGGASCWQGPQRSMTVTVECGVDPEVYNVQEPSKCTYTASMRHPALCTPPAATHDEL